MQGRRLSFSSAAISSAAFNRRVSGGKPFARPQSFRRDCELATLHEATISLCRQVRRCHACGGEGGKEEDERLCWGDAISLSFPEHK